MNSGLSEMLDGMWEPDAPAHVGEVFGAATFHQPVADRQVDALLAVDHQVVRALVDAVQVLEVFFELGLPVEQVAHIFPVLEVAAFAENEVSVSFSLRFFGIAKNV